MQVAEMVLAYEIDLAVLGRNSLRGCFFVHDIAGVRQCYGA
ncbi:hypothetical protein [Vreelandella subglaciescola]|nr:hypothetical protein [Halomonas subglaciescola]